MYETWLCVNTQSLLPVNFTDFFNILVHSFITMEQWNLLECNAKNSVGFL